MITSIREVVTDQKVSNYRPGPIINICFTIICVMNRPISKLETALPTKMTYGRKTTK